jgi:hypothetical protein
MVRTWLTAALAVVLTVLWTAVLTTLSPAYALEIGGVALPETLDAGGKSLVLNGAGLRKKFFFKIYAGALYLPEKESDPGKIVPADEPMAVRMHFIYDGVSAEKLIETWNEGFEKTTGGRPGPLSDRIVAFNGLFTEEAGEGDVYDIVYTPSEGVRVVMNGRAAGTIQGLDFKTALFAIWLGEDPADDGLKREMLGR